MIYKILHQVLIFQFYQRNAGMFLLAFILLFGIVPASQVVHYHLTIIRGIISIPAFLGIVLVIWFLYGLKCLQFVWKVLQEPSNEFLYKINQLTHYQQFSYCIYLQVWLYLPIWLYAILTSGVAFYEGFIETSFIILIFNVLYISLSAYFYHSKLNHPDSGKAQAIWLSFLDKQITKPFRFWFIYLIFKDLRWIFLFSKLFSWAVFWVFFNFFAAEIYDVRIPLLAFLIALLGNSVLIFEIRKFENTYLNFVRNLPISLARRFGQFIGIYFLILIPEYLILIQACFQKQLIWADFGVILVFGVFILMLFHCLLYQLGENMEMYLRWVFTIFLIAYFLILYKIYILTTVFLGLWAGWIFWRDFYNFEKLETEK